MNKFQIASDENIDPVCHNCHYWETFSCWHWSLAPDHLPNDTCREFYPLDNNADEVRVSAKDEKHMNEIEAYAKTLGLPS